MTLLILILAVSSVWSAMTFCALYVAKKHDEAREQALNEYLRERSEGKGR